MDKQKKIDKIYEVIADKTISDGLIYEKFGVKFDYCKICQNRIDEEDTIIGHPVMILVNNGDVYIIDDDTAYFNDGKGNQDILEVEREMRHSEGINFIFYSIE